MYGHWGSTTYSGTRTWYAGGGVAGTTASGSYYNSRTGTSGTLQRRPAVQRVDRQRHARLRPHGEHAPPAAPPTSRARGNYNTYTGQRSTGSSVSGTGAGGSTYNRAGATTAGPEGDAHVGGGSTYNAKTGKTNTWGTASVGNNHYADVNGNVYKNTGDGWQQHSSSGWGERVGRHVVGRPRIAGAQHRRRPRGQLFEQCRRPVWRRPLGWRFRRRWLRRFRAVATASAAAASVAAAASAVAAAVSAAADSAAAAGADREQCDAHCFRGSGSRNR